MYALVLNGVIEQVGDLPKIWWDGARYWDFRDPGLVDLAALGWLPVNETARPPDTALTTFDRSVELVNGEPTEVWTERNKTTEELADDTYESNRSSIETKALAALTANNDYLAIASPSNAEVLAQVRVITRECNGLIRLVLNQLDSDDA